MSTLNPAEHQMLVEAIEHQKSGRLQLAEAGYKRILQLHPHLADAQANLALAQYQQGKFDDGLRSMERAVALRPSRVDLLDLLGSWYNQQGNPLRAITLHRAAIAISPNNPASHANLALALAKKHGGLDQALAEARKAAELAPTEAEAQRILGVVCEQARRFDDAIEAFAKGIAIKPDLAECYGRSGLCFESLDRLDSAVAILQAGIRHCPNEPQLHANLSAVLRKLNRFAEALAAADRAIALADSYGEAHGHRSLALLALGEYEQGFLEYEWRWRCEDFTTRPRDFNVPLWDGSDPAGRTILVHAEQGHGDSLQFARYLPMLADRDATVIFECHHSLRKLMSRVRGVSRVIVAGTSLPRFDLHAPLLSLPRAFHTTMETVPRDVPYLFADAARKQIWNERFKAQAAGKLKVGLIWAGNAKPDARRTVSSDGLRLLAGIANVQFFGLQKQDAGTYQPAPAELNLIDAAGDLTDFDETAAAMTALDLIVTIDTGPAHLAGGLGCKTLLMLPWAPDWRWLAGDQVSHWYPTIRKFRQTKQENWIDVIERVRGEIESIAIAADGG